jgi:hypothetical protein
MQFKNCARRKAFRSQIVQSEMHFVHSEWNLLNTPKPSSDKSREPLSAERRAQTFGSPQMVGSPQKSKTPKLPSRAFRNDRLKAMIWCIKSLVQMGDLLFPSSLPTALLTQFLAAKC